MPELGPREKPKLEHKYFQSRSQNEVFQGPNRGLRTRKSETIRASQQGRGQTTPQRNHIESEVPTCSHPIFWEWVGSRTGWTLAKYNEIVYHWSKSVYCLTRFLRTQDWHGAASISTWPKPRLMKPRAQCQVAQQSGRLTRSHSDLFGPSSPWKVGEQASPP